jgi:leader peptidase (prepilin peptidase)/N-methyltransferase
MELFFIISTFVLGAIIGSFLNVTIYRHNTGRGFGGRSACMSCAQELGWHELIPIVSYLALAGKCSKCQSKISPMYPLVELVTGFAFAFIFYSQLPILDTLGAVRIIYLWSVFSILIMIAAYDIRLKIIPDAPVYTFILLSVLAPIMSYGFGVQVFYNILAGLALAAPFALLWLLSKGRLMGLGDAKLALGLGIMLGLSQGLAAVMIAFWIGALLGIVLLLLRAGGLTMKSEMPLGPFLALGAFVAVVGNYDLASIANLFQLINF